jgi:hypothetical protein
VVDAGSFVIVFVLALLIALFASLVVLLVTTPSRSKQ